MPLITAPLPPFTFNGYGLFAAFTNDEFDAIRVSTDTDVVNAFQRWILRPLVMFILADADFIADIELLFTNSLLTADRRDEILNGDGIIGK